MEKGSIKDWDDMKSQFHKKFFNVQKQVTMVELVRLGQRVNEDFLDYMIWFRTSASKCVESIEENNVVNVCQQSSSKVQTPHKGMSDFCRIMHLCTRHWASDTDIAR